MTWVQQHVRLDRIQPGDWIVHESRCSARQVVAVELYTDHVELSPDGVTARPYVAVTLGTDRIGVTFSITGWPESELVRLEPRPAEVPNAAR